MDRQPITLRGLEPVVATLTLQWPVSYWHVPAANTCQIVCLPDEQRHEVWLLSSAAKNPNEWLPELVHELCHAALAERLDPTFATAYFGRGDEYGNLAGEALVKFTRQVQTFYLAWAHIDVWVDELRHHHWPELSQVEAERFAEAVSFVAAADQQTMLHQPLQRVALAVHLAEERRFGLPASGLERLANQSHWSIEALAKLYQRLPVLPIDRQEALAVLEQSVLQVVDLLKLGIKPELIDAGDRAAWQFK